MDQLAIHSAVLEDLREVVLPVWRTLGDVARQQCLLYGWAAIGPSTIYESFKEEAALRGEELSGDALANFELVALRAALCVLSARFYLMNGDEPALWAVDTIVQTLQRAARRAEGVKVPAWVHFEEMHVAYPAGDPDFKPVGFSADDEDPFVIHIRIPCKQPDEGFPAFERRFNQACREVRDKFVAELKEQGWTTRAPFLDFKWIDLLAQWQVKMGTPASAIDPSAATEEGRITFSRRTAEAADYIGVTRRKGAEFPKQVVES